MPFESTSQQVVVLDNLDLKFTWKCNLHGNKQPESKFTWKRFRFANATSNKKANRFKLS